MAPPDDRPEPATAAAGEERAAPARTMTALDAGVVVVGVVLGVGIFRSPQVVAANVDGGFAFLALWVAGGAIAFVGALCYAELATAYPDAGGEYYLLSRAYGDDVGFFVAWSRIAVIQTGSIAILAYVFGDYLAGLPLPGLGEASPPVLAAGMVVVLTGVNVAGLEQGRGAQYLLTGATLLGLLAVGAAGLLLPADPPAPDPAGGATADGGGSAGLALVFVLLAFGGWSEGAYVSAEVRDRRRGVARALLWGTGAVTLVYLVANAAYLRGMGLRGVAGAEAVAAELMASAVGPWGRWAVTGAIVVAALSSANATIITGARSTYALGRDWSVFGFLGGWARDRHTPIRALLVQGAIALLLVGFGALERSGFEAMVAYTAPVYWLVLLLTGAAVLVQRRRDPDAERPFRVPLYPVTPLVFCAASGLMAYSAVSDAGTGALLGLAVVATGIPFLWLSRRRPDPQGATRTDR